MVTLLSFAVVACGPADEDENGEEEATEPEDETLQVGIVLSTGGLGDQSFNDAAYRGLEWAEEDFDIEFTHIEPEDVAEDAQSLRQFAERGYDLIFGVGFQMADSLETVAQEYPDIKFGHVDEDFGEDIPDNVESLNFAEHEGSFLAGALAAKVSESGTIGYVGGEDFGLIHRFEGGFVQGAQYIDEDIEIISDYAASFEDSGRGREIALSFIDRGADVIYHAAGGSGMGVIEAAEESGIYAIGVDSNQNWVAPGHVITSMLKQVDNAVYETVERVIDGTYEGGLNREFGLEDDGVSLSSLTEIDVEEEEAVELESIDEEDLEVIKEMKKEITAPHKERIEELEQKIIDEEIEVEDWMFLDERPDY
ncbi:BMP family ABC transporter substrate-binding protein [Natranaerobius trueperi]|uniref:BMP family ABC transporter substrate-binding protein n=2 Tax=Natranaerobius trueperi TaxID=759412 RepID=A0A226C0N7_9FIRM|nr:BMP family ABC transporter substrate-binding protein [Natranaerobius trueperi]